MTAATETPTKKSTAVKLPEFTTEAQAEEYIKMWDKKFIRVDPTTGQEHESNKEFFWQVIHIFPAYAGNGNESQFVTQILAQKYYRNQTYKVPSGPNSNAPDTVKYVAYQERNRHGDLINLGQWCDDAEKFKKQFKEDKTL